MTLTPETRVLLTDGLRPPAGYRVDLAVGTTYSLNLTALLLAPLSFAVFDQPADEELGGVDPVRLLEAVRRHSEHTTVFCQAGAIHVPSRFRSILTFVEDSVVQVMPPTEGAIFHPKVWALRFADADGRHLHRVLVLSRNMTLDRSWDTALVLDEAPDGAIDAGPAAAFVRSLPGLATQPLGPDRLAAVEDLAATLERVRLAAPRPFTGGHLLPIGLDGTEVWPFPDRAFRLLAISPFLTAPALAELGALCTRRTLVSRAESLDLVGGAALAGWEVRVLNRVAETDPDGDVTDDEPAVNEYVGSHEGLHAKTFVLDERGTGTSMTVTGSANLTGRRWGRNVEFDAVLTGPTATCGVRTVLEGRPEAPGLDGLLEDYDVNAESALTPSMIAVSQEVEQFHQLLAAGLPVAHVTAVDEERVTATVTFTVPADPPGTTRVWPVSLARDVHGQPLDTSLTWTMAPASVTPFIAVETTAEAGGERVTRRCVVKAILTGAVDGRRQDAVMSVLRSRDDVLRYLVLLLGDPGYDAMFAALAGVDDVAGSREGWTGADGTSVALLEPMIRAVGRDTEALARVAALVEELRALPNGRDLVPEGFDDLWDVIWQVHSEGRQP